MFSILCNKKRSILKGRGNPQPIPPLRRISFKPRLVKLSSFLQLKSFLILHKFFFFFFLPSFLSLFCFAFISDDCFVQKKKGYTMSGLSSSWAFDTYLLNWRRRALRTRVRLWTATLLHDHVLYVFLNDVLAIVVVEHGHGPQFGGHTTWLEVGKGAVAPHAVMVDDSRVER